MNDYWEKHWNEEDHNFDRKRVTYLDNFKFKQLKKIIKTLPNNARILEVGCGNALWLDFVRSEFPNLELHGLDIIDLGKKLENKKIHFKQGDIRKAPYDDNYFDLVFSWGVIEHFQENQQAILEHIRITKKGGYSLIETPNRKSLQGLEFNISNRFIRKRKKEDYIRDIGIFFSPRDLEAMTRATTNIEIKIVCSGPFFPLSRYLGFIERIVPSFLRKKFGGNAGILVKKA